MNMNQRLKWLKAHGTLGSDGVRLCEDGGSVYKFGWIPKNPAKYGTKPSIVVHGNNRPQAIRLMYAVVKDYLYEETNKNE